MGTYNIMRSAVPEVPAPLFERWDSQSDPLILSQGVLCNTLSFKGLRLTVCRLCAKFR